MSITAPSGTATDHRTPSGDNVRWFADLGLADLEQVGGKNSSLGEMISQPRRPRRAGAGRLRDDGGRVPAVRAAAAWRSGSTGCSRASTSTTSSALARGRQEIREAVLEQPFPADWRRTSARPSRSSTPTATGRRRSPCARARRPRTCRTRRSPGSRRPSSTCGASTRCCTAIHEVFASLYNDRAIAYRVHHGFAHDVVALSAGVQRMVRSDLGASGVMFTMDTESGFPDAVFVTPSYGLGEAVVQGAVNPDEFYVYKPALRGGPAGDPQARVGGKATKMIYTDDRAVGPDDRVRRRRPRPQRGLLSPDRRRGRRAGAARDDDRGALRPPDGHRVGQGRPRRAALHPPGPAGDGAVAPARPRTSSRYRLAGTRRPDAARRGPRDRAEDRRRRRAGAAST